MTKRKQPRPWVDPDDAPKLTAERAARADLYVGAKLIRAGRHGPNPLVAKALRQTSGTLPANKPKP
jgi:hypothetical protein